MATRVIRSRARNDGDVKERRRYNREYMRRWRADPRHRDRENANRFRCHPRKVEPKPLGDSLCGFCHQRRLKSKVLRLRPVDEGYVTVLVPYCGEC